MNAIDRPAVTGLERAAELDQAERMVAELPVRLSTARSLEAQAMMLRTAVDLTRQLVARRDGGLEIPASTIELAFDALEEGLDRMIELMPADPPRSR